MSVRQRASAEGQTKDKSNAVTRVASRLDSWCKLVAGAILSGWGATLRLVVLVVVLGLMIMAVLAVAGPWGGAIAAGAVGVGKWVQHSGS